MRGRLDFLAIRRKAPHPIKEVGTAGNRGIQSRAMAFIQFNHHRFAAQRIVVGWQIQG